MVSHQVFYCSQIIHISILLQVNAKLGQAELFMIRLPRAPETPVSGGARLAGQSLVATLEPAGVVRFMPTSLLPQVSELDGQVRDSLMLFFYCS